MIQDKNGNWHEHISGENQHLFSREQIDRQNQELNAANASLEKALEDKPEDVLRRAHMDQWLAGIRDGGEVAMRKAVKHVQRTSDLTKQEARQWIEDRLKETRD